MNLQAQSALDLARNIERNERATQTKKARNKAPDSRPDLLRDVASARLPEKYHLEAICRRACRDLPGVEPDQLIRFLSVAGDPDWCTERLARHLAGRMAEGLIKVAALEGCDYPSKGSISSGKPNAIDNLGTNLPNDFGKIRRRSWEG